MPDSDAIKAIYDFEAVMEMALAQLFDGNQIKAFTTQWIAKTGNAETDAANEADGYSLLDFQLDRPRVMVEFVPGAGAGQFTNKVIAGVEMPVETSWSGQFKIELITAPESRLHASYRTMCRYIMHTQLLSLNGNALTLHKIQSFPKDAGTTPRMKGEDGAFQTIMLFDVDFSVQDDAWNSFAT
ncbi:MAG: hypothetical protein KGL39_42195 [Patescibacteria group bacterium]|nr:hypothetical protein [Patescibacteria group bacterium]